MVKKVLLDTSFILSCIKQKIDFFNWLNNEGYSIIVPKQVLIELEGLSKSDLDVKIALNLIERNKPSHLDLNNKNTDKAIINYSKKNPEIIIATLDKEIKQSINNKKLIIRQKSQLEIV